MSEVIHGTGEDVDMRQALVPALTDWACIGGKNDENHPNYRSVTEGRDVGAMQKGYSSCGDLGHWLLYRLGARQPWINRKEHRGWRVGMNVSLLCHTAPTTVRMTPMRGDVLEPGDIIISWAKPDSTDAHVMVVREFSLDPLRLVVAEYGAPGGQVAEKNISIRGDRYYIAGKYGTKVLQVWLPLHLALADAAERGLLAEVTLPW